jgi:predicted kinase
MPTLIITVGLPASGKSTWATSQVLAAPPGAIVRVNKDLLRTMLHADRHAKGTEAQVLKARDALISSFLRAGVDVIVDDTNLVRHHHDRLSQLAERLNATFVVKDFTEVPLQTCIERDAARPNPVGATVISEMYERHLAHRTV